MVRQISESEDNTPTSRPTYPTTDTVGLRTVTKNALLCSLEKSPRN